MCGIYRIVNNFNGRMYIGASKNIEKRFHDHYSKCYYDKQEWNKHLYQEMRKYGRENFTSEVIEECPEEQLNDREIYWISYYNTYEDPEEYNDTPGGPNTGEKNRHIGEDHGKALLTEDDVKFCRKCYAEGKRSKDIYNLYFKDKMTYSGFQRMWHGLNWSYIMPEVFEHNPHRKEYYKADCDKIRELYYSYDPPITLWGFLHKDECYVGYGTLWKMIHHPEYYKDKQ